MGQPNALISTRSYPANPAENGRSLAARNFSPIELIKSEQYLLSLMLMKHLYCILLGCCMAIEVVWGQAPPTIAKSKQNVPILLALAQKHATLKPDSAVLCAGQALDLARHFRDTVAMLTALQLLGNQALNSAQHQKGLDYSLQRLTIHQTQRDTTGIVEVLNSMSLVFRQQRKFAEGSQLLREALQHLPNPDKTAELAGKTNNNIGSLYYMGANYDSAQFYFEKAYFYRLKTGQQIEIAKSLNNLGLIHKRRGNYAKALDNFMACKKILEKSTDSLMVTNTLDNIGDMYNLLDQPQLAKQYHLQGLNMARRAGSRDKVWDSYESLSETYAKLNDYKTAYRYAQLKNALKDSLYDEQNARQVGELKSKFDNEKKEKEIALLTKENQIKDLEAGVNERRNWFLFIALVLASGLALLAWSRFNLKNKANHLLEARNEEINQQKEELTAQRNDITEKSDKLTGALEELDKKNRDLFSSLNYAARIQGAILPRLSVIQQQLPDSFVFYRPKEIVSGDFYWFAHVPENEPDTVGKKSERLIIVAADCTGHGVPGAFMSLIGIKLLNNLVVLRNITDPEALLTALNQEVRTTLRQYETANRDGMDIGICVLHREWIAQPNDTCTSRVTHLEFAGARSPLVLVRGEELHEYKGNKISVGGDKEREDQGFAKQQIAVQPGDMCYLYSDGYQDQFGGDLDRKFMPRRLKALLLAHAAQPAAQQQAAFVHAFEAWQGDGPQIDDVLLLGFRVE